MGAIFGWKPPFYLSFKLTFSISVVNSVTNLKCLYHLHFLNKFILKSVSFCLCFLFSSISTSEDSMAVRIQKATSCPGVANWHSEQRVTARLLGSSARAAPARLPTAYRLQSKLKGRGSEGGRQHFFVWSAEASVCRLHCARYLYQAAYILYGLSLASTA